MRLSPAEPSTIPGKVLQPISLISCCRGTAVRERTALFSDGTTSFIFLWPQPLIKGHYYVCLVGTLRNITDRIMPTGWLPGLGRAPSWGLGPGCSRLPWAEGGGEGAPEGTPSPGGAQRWGRVTEKDEGAGPRPWVPVAGWGRGSRPMVAPRAFASGTLETQGTSGKLQLLLSPSGSASPGDFWDPELATELQASFPTSYAVWKVVAVALKNKCKAIS